jgi:hypothetical protein
MAARCLGHSSAAQPELREVKFYLIELECDCECLDPRSSWTLDYCSAMPTLPQLERYSESVWMPSRQQLAASSFMY